MHRLLHTTQITRCDYSYMLYYSIHDASNREGPFFLTPNKFNPSINNHIPSKMWDEISYLFPNFNCATVEVWERIKKIIPHFIMDVITCTSWVKPLWYKGSKNLSIRVQVSNIKYCAVLLMRWGIGANNLVFKLNHEETNYILTQRIVKKNHQCSFRYSS